jgi:predicted nucleic acid-binding protein
LSGFVIDASVLATWFLEDETDARVEFLVESLARLGACSPSLFFFEIRNALLVNERRRRVTAAQSAEFVRELSRMRIRLESPRQDVDLLALARERKLTVYDAAYLELAVREGLPLATLGRALEKAAIAEGVALLSG